MRLVAAPWFFRLPWLRRFDGYATHRVILVRTRAHADDGDLVTHELCHVWQMQHRPLRMPLSYLRGYAGNRYELEARGAVERTRRPRVLRGVMALPAAAAVSLIRSGVIR